MKAKLPCSAGKHFLNWLKILLLHVKAIAADTV